MDMNKFFGEVEKTLLARFRQAEIVQHSGDKGENREHILREFLKSHLPARYGVTKGEIITQQGKHSHAADIIIYDALNCPVLYVEQTAVIPIEGVFGIIEVKSTLSKHEFVSAANKIYEFKSLAMVDLNIIRTREYITFHRPSRPFGVIVGYQLGSNSLESLHRNYLEICQEKHFVSGFCNLTVVLGNGLIHFERIDWSQGEKHLLLDTDEFVGLVGLAEKRRRNAEPGADDFLLRLVTEELGPNTLGRFVVYLLIMLERMKVGLPEIGRYIDPNLPYIVHRES